MIKNLFLERQLKRRSLTHQQKHEYWGEVQSALELKNALKSIRQEFTKWQTNPSTIIQSLIYPSCIDKEPLLQFSIHENNDKNTKHYYYLGLSVLNKRGYKNVIFRIRKIIQKMTNIPCRLDDRIIRKLFPEHQ